MREQCLVSILKRHGGRLTNYATHLTGFFVISYAFQEKQNSIYCSNQPTLDQAIQNNFMKMNGKNLAKHDLNKINMVYEKENLHISDTDITWASQEFQKNKLGIKQIQANTTLEDRAFIVSIPSAKNGSLLCAAVIDGHGGWQVAEYVQRKLPGFIQHFVQANTTKRPLTNEELGEALRQAFCALDENLLYQLKGSVDVGFSQGLRIGACCNCVLITEDALICANSGDCRSILVTNRNKSRWLASSHNANEPQEQAKLKQEHPHETNIVVCKEIIHMNGNKKNWTEYVTQWLTMHACQQRLRHCYVKGRLQPTRSFGDFYLKYEVLSYDKETQSPLLKEGKSFPYITVVPDITIHKRKMNSVKWGSENKCSFIVLASDGVWDFLTKEEAAEIVSDCSMLSVDTSCQRVLEKVLQKAAKQAGISVTDILRLSTKKKRQFYDDATVCIIRLNTP